MTASPDAPRGVLFDLDGTLVDTTYLHVVAWARAFRSVGAPTPMARIHRLIGMGSDRLIPEVLGRDDDEANERHGQEFKAIRDEAGPLPGARDLVRAAHERGLTVVLATSAKPDDAEHLAGLLDAGESVDAMTTSEDAGSSKPAPDIFATAMDTCGLAPEQVITVGDTRWDVEASAKLGVPTVALETGGWAACELREVGAGEVYRDPVELLDRFDRSLLASR